jgi:MFS family permease
LVWGGGPLLIRYIIRRWHLGWKSLLCLALALSIAEEFLIQQTSVAPMVIHLKGVIYARAFGINYVYLFWALIYESVSVVILPIYLTELIFPERKKDLWINKGGVIFFSSLFLLGSFAAWFTWTQIARVKVFHLSAYRPSLSLVAFAIIAIAFLIFLATRQFVKKTPPAKQRVKQPAPWLLIISGGIWSILLFGLVLLGFGIQPLFAPIFAIIGALILAIAPLYFLPRWTINPGWDRMNTFSTIFGVMLGSMLITFVGFIDALPKDLYFKIIVDAIAIVSMIVLGLKTKTYKAKETILPETIAI